MIYKHEEGEENVQVGITFQLKNKVGSILETIPQDKFQMCWT